MLGCTNLPYVPPDNSAGSTAHPRLPPPCLPPPACTNIPGFKFYRLQDAIGAEIRKAAAAGSALSAQTVQSYADECNGLTLCNAFNT